MKKDRKSGKKKRQERGEEKRWKKEEWKKKKEKRYIQGPREGKNRARDGETDKGERRERYG